ncbi:hypothetical Protein psc1_03160 [Candidatus Phytoplasma solani]
MNKLIKKIILIKTPNKKLNLVLIRETKTQNLENKTQLIYSYYIYYKQKFIILSQL